MGNKNNFWNKFRSMKMTISFKIIEFIHFILSVKF